LTVFIDQTFQLIFFEELSGFLDVVFSLFQEGAE
jgi:hypothetical protein